MANESLNNTDDKERIERAKAAGWTGIVRREDNDKLVGCPPFRKKGRWLV